MEHPGHHASVSGSAFARDYDPRVTSSGCLVGISGQIGTGKSTLARTLAAHFGFATVLEEVNSNPYLARFYREPARWGLQNFLFFFEHSLTGQVRARAASAGTVQERLPQEHLEVFGREFHARGFLGDDEMAVLERLAATALSLVAPPTVLVHLDIEPEAALGRILGRGREAERGLGLEYLEALGARYEAFVANWSLCPIIRIDTAAVDVRQPEGASAVADLVSQEIPDAARTRVV